MVTRAIARPRVYRCHKIDVSCTSYSRYRFPSVTEEGRLEGDEHPPIEMLARWLAGRLEHDHLVQQVAPHFLPRCPVCRENVDEIRRLQAEVGHWD